MVASINIALTGLAAADARLKAAANNLANQNSTARVENGQTVTEPFQREEVQQISQATGGVRTESRVSEREPLKVFAPDHPDADESGFLSVPNIDTAEELVNAKIAAYDYKANLKTIDVQNKLFDNLLDILT